MSTKDDPVVCSNLGLAVKGARETKTGLNLSLYPRKVFVPPFVTSVCFPE